MTRSIALLVLFASATVFASGSCECSGEATLSQHRDSHIVAELSSEPQCNGYGCCARKGQKSELYFEKKDLKEGVSKNLLNEYATYLRDEAPGYEFKYYYYCHESERYGADIKWLVERKPK